MGTHVQAIFGDVEPCNGAHARLAERITNLEALAQCLCSQPNCGFQVGVVEAILDELKYVRDGSV